MDFTSLFTPSVGGALNFGMNIWQKGAQIGAQGTAAWKKWESDTLNAIRRSQHENKTNFRQHHVDMKNWEKQSQYVAELNQYENKLATEAAKLKTETSVNAMEALGREYADLDARFYEEEATDTLQLEEIKQKSISDAVKQVSGGQVGASIQRMYNTHNQQYLQNAGNRLITREFRVGDKLAAMRAGNLEAKNKANSIRLYNPSPFKDPVKPDSPLPAETYLPGQPTVKTSLSLLDVASAGMSAYNNYMDNKPLNQSYDDNDNDNEDEGGGGDEGGDKGGNKGGEQE